MPYLADLIALLHTALLTAFVVVTALLMLVTVANRLRLRNVRLSWRGEGSFAFPIAPTLFITAVLACLAYAALSEAALSPLLFAGYLLGGVFWFVSGLFTAAFTVTDCGLVRNGRRVSHAIGWGQIVDYFEQPHEGRHRFVFFYLDRAGHRRRFEVDVPTGRYEAFQGLVAERLETRFDPMVEERVGNKALER